MLTSLLPITVQVKINLKGTKKHFRCFQVATILRLLSIKCSNCSSNDQRHIIYRLLIS